MIKAVLLSSLVFLIAACGPADEVAPTLAGEVAGTYQTNGFLDYLCIALPADKMPVASITPETESTVTVTYLQRYPADKKLVINDVRLNRLADNGIELIQQGYVLGSVRTDRAFGSNGMERQALVLRLKKDAQNNDASFTFTGSKE